MQTFFIFVFSSQTPAGRVKWLACWSHVCRQTSCLDFCVEGQRNWFGTGLLLVMFSTFASVVSDKVLIKCRQIVRSDEMIK